MKSYRFALVRKQFTFVDQIAASIGEQSDARLFDSTQIRPADNALMARKPTVNSWSSCAGGHHDYDSFWGVVRDEDGSFQLHKLDEEGERGNPQGTDYLSAENIGDQLFRLGIQPDFLVEVVQNDTDDYDRGELSRHLTIYKVLDGDSYGLVDYFCAKVDFAAAELKAELTAAFSLTPTVSEAQS
jgi:hypothetical protein